MIDILVERRRAFESVSHYKLKFMLAGLDRAGVPWRLIDDPEQATGGEAAFLHVDLTDVPEAFLSAARRYDRCVNGEAATIRRTLYSAARLQPGDSHAGPVIVKTVLNSHGAPELRYRNRKSALTRAGYVAKRLLLPGYKSRACPEYRVLPSIDAVPDRVWKNERLIVERFLPGTTALPVIKQRFDFFFDVEINTRTTYRSLLCDPATMMHIEIAPDVPEEIRRLRKKLNLDFGAIDYFIADGQPIAIDANKTVATTESWRRRVPFVARHIEDVTDRLVAFATKG
ncbi:hypothetical protein [Oricola sp.]|uniref:hypothetical protein n=1 Tax=Oricola sp. TaxID=1979950 RepID=UPI0025F1A27B|nr:hypothetical protein [Oricola sp.]MCI5076342.1 hypothetical protein [Oricola sp.]